MACLSRIADMDTGGIGRRCAGYMAAEPAINLDTIIRSMEALRTFAINLVKLWFPEIASVLSARRPDDGIVATANPRHRTNCFAALATGLPVLAGHCRQHNILMKRFKAMVDGGQLSPPVGVPAGFWLITLKAIHAIPPSVQSGKSISGT